MEKTIYNLIEQQVIQEFNILGVNSIQKTKELLSSVEAALNNKDLKKLKKISKSLPKKDYPEIFKLADKQFTDFKRNYMDAKRKLKSKNIVDEEHSVPVAIGTAVVASSLKRDVDTIVKDVTKNLKDKKAFFFLIPGSRFVLKTVFIILILCWIYVTNGAAIGTILKVMGLLLSLLGFVLQKAVGIFEGIVNAKTVAGDPIPDAWPSDGGMGVTTPMY